MIGEGFLLHARDASNYSVLPLVKLSVLPLVMLSNYSVTIPQVKLSVLPLSSLISYSVAYSNVETTVRVFTAMSGGGSFPDGEERVEVVPSAAFILHNAKETDPVCVGDFI